MTKQTYTYEAPELPGGCIAYEWERLDQTVVCHLDFEPETGDGWNEPHYEARVTFMEAYLLDVNITDLLSAADIRRIEEAALIEHLERIKEDRDEERIQAYQSLRATFD